MEKHSQLSQNVITTKLFLLESFTVYGNELCMYRFFKWQYLIVGITKETYGFHKNIATYTENGFKTIKIRHKCIQFWYVQLLHCQIATYMYVIKIGHMCVIKSTWCYVYVHTYIN